MEGTATPLKPPPHLTALDQVSTHRPVSPLMAPWRSAGYEGTLWTLSQESCPPGQRWNPDLTGVTGRLEEVSGPGSPKAETDSPYVPVSSFPDLCCFRFPGRAPDGRRDQGLLRAEVLGLGGLGGFGVLLLAGEEGIVVMGGHSKHQGSRQTFFQTQGLRKILERG